MLLPCCAASSLSKRLTALLIDSSTGVTLAFSGKLYISRFQSLAVLSLRDSLRAAPMKVLGDVTAKIPPKGQEISNAPPRACIQWLTSGRVSENSFFRTRFQCFFKRPPTFFFQETHYFDSKTSTSPTYNVYCKGCSQRHQGQGVQKVCLPYKNALCTLRARKGSHPRNNFPSQE